jgi:hypothetical protein
LTRSPPVFDAVNSACGWDSPFPTPAPGFPKATALQQSGMCRALILTSRWLGGNGNGRRVASGEEGRRTACSACFLMKWRELGWCKRGASSLLLPVSSQEDGEQMMAAATATATAIWSLSSRPASVLICPEVSLRWVWI